MNEVLQMDGEWPFDDGEGNSAFKRLFRKFLNLFISGGTVTVDGTSPVTVTDSNFKAGSTVVFSLKTIGGTVGAIPRIATPTAGTGFTVVATASDTSIYNYKIINL